MRRVQDVAPIFVVFLGPAVLAAEIHLRSPACSLTLADGAIVSFRDVASGREFIAPDRRISLFGLRVSQSPAGNPTILTAQDAMSADVEARPDRAVLSFRRIGGHDLHAICTVTREAGGFRFGMALRGAGDVRLYDVRYPQMALCPVPGDTLVVPRFDGGVLADPLRHLSARGRKIVLSQPGNCLAQFIALYDRQAGLLLAAQDTRGNPKSLQVAGDKNGPTMSLIHPGFRDELGYDCLLRTFPGDWYDAADLYRAWAERQWWCAKPLAARDDLPAWVGRGPAIVLIDPRTRASDGELRYGPPRIKAWYKAWCDFLAVPPIVHLRGWERHGMWVAPEYFPAAPDEDRTFRAINDTVRAGGGHSFVFLSGHEWALEYRPRKATDWTYQSRERFDREAKPHATITRDGAIYEIKSPWLNGGTNVRLCRGDAWTRSLIAEQTRQCVERGVDVVQLDQVVGGFAPACFSDEHGHPPGSGPWLHDSLVEQFEMMKRAGAPRAGDFCLSMEQANELYLPQLQLVHSRQHQFRVMGDNAGLEPIPLLGYLYHDFVIAYAGWISHGVNVSDESLRIQLARSVVYGMVPGVYDRHFAPNANRYANARKLLKNCTDLISGAGQPFLVLGRMLRPPPLACDTVTYSIAIGGFGGRKRGPKKAMELPAVLVGAFRAPDGREAVVLVNHTLEARTVQLAGQSFELAALAAQLRQPNGEPFRSR